MQLPVLDLATDGVLREYVHAERVRVPVPEALSHLLPGIVERRAIFVVLGHGGGAATAGTEHGNLDSFSLLLPVVVVFQALMICAHRKF